MIKKLIVMSAATALLTVSFAGTAFAGQPGAECGGEGATSAPAGFGTWGFSNAEGHYAGSDGTHSLISHNAHAVSQYDIACVNVTSAGR